MKLIAFVVFLSVGCLGWAQQLVTNFCDPTLCPTGIKQTGCNNTGAFGPLCPAGVEIITLTTAMKQALAQKHNQYRQQIASGNLTGYLPAVRMATMRWNAELAQMALYNAITCVFAHDKCRATTQFRYSGQNIAKNWWSGADPTDLFTSVVLPQVDAWWAEHTSATMADINSYPATTTVEIGHFTVMTAEKNTAFGCGIVKFKDPTLNNDDSLTMVCNYARTNIISLPLYRSGVTASLCTTGVNPNYPALCSLNESYNLNLQ